MNRNYFCSKGTAGRGRFFELFHIAGGYCQMRARFRESQRTSPAYAGRGACDNNNFIFESHFFMVSYFGKSFSVKYLILPAKLNKTNEKTPLYEIMQLIEVNNAS